MNWSIYYYKSLRKAQTQKHVFNNITTSVWKPVTHAGCWTYPITPLQLFSNLLHANMNCPWTLVTNPYTAPPLLHIPEGKQLTPPVDPLSRTGMHATRPARFLLTLPLVEPQHAASKHRHGRGHEEGERAGGPWTVEGDPTKRKQDGELRDKI